MEALSKFQERDDDKKAFQDLGRLAQGGSKFRIAKKAGSIIDTLKADLEEFARPKEKAEELKPWINGILEHVKLRLQEVETFPTLSNMLNGKVVEDLKKHFVFCPVDKTPQTMAMVCKTLYREALNERLTGYEASSMEELQAAIQKFHKRRGTPGVSYLYLMPKFTKGKEAWREVAGHRGTNGNFMNPIGQRCAHLAQAIIDTLKAQARGLKLQDGVERMMCATSVKEVGDMLREGAARWANEKFVKTDFAQMYLELKAQRVKDAIQRQVEKAYRHAAEEWARKHKSEEIPSTMYLKPHVVNGKYQGRYWSTEQEKDFVSLETVVESCRNYIENFFFKNGDIITRQAAALAIGGTPCQQFANLYCIDVEAAHIEHLLQSDKADEVKRVGGYRDVVRFVDDCMAAQSSAWIMPTTDMYDLKYSSKEAAETVFMTGYEVSASSGKCTVRMGEKQRIIPFPITRYAHAESCMPLCVSVGSVAGMLYYCDQQSDKTVETFLANASVLFELMVKRRLMPAVFTKGIKKYLQRQRDFYSGSQKHELRKQLFEIAEKRFDEAATEGKSWRVYVGEVRQAEAQAEKESRSKRATHATMAAQSDAESVRGISASRTDSSTQTLEFTLIRTEPVVEGTQPDGISTVSPRTVLDTRSSHGTQRELMLAREQEVSQTIPVDATQSVDPTLIVGAEQESDEDWDHGAETLDHDDIEDLQLNDFFAIMNDGYSCSFIAAIMLLRGLFIGWGSTRMSPGKFHSAEEQQRWKTFKKFICTESKTDAMKIWRARLGPELRRGDQDAMEMFFGLQKIEPLLEDVWFREAGLVRCIRTHCTFCGAEEFSQDLVPMMQFKAHASTRSFEPDVTAWYRGNGVDDPFGDPNTKEACRRCKKSDATKISIRVESLPNVLMLAFDRTNQTVATVNRFNCKLKQELALQNKKGDMARYELVGTICCTNRHINSGHYFTFFKSKNGKWYRIENIGSQQSLQTEANWRDPAENDGTVAAVYRRIEEVVTTEQSTAGRRSFKEVSSARKILGSGVKSMFRRLFGLSNKESSGNGSDDNEFDPISSQGEHSDRQAASLLVDQMDRGVAFMGGHERMGRLSSRSSGPVGETLSVGVQNNDDAQVRNAMHSDKENELYWDTTVCALPLQCPPFD
jgi:hypothetical protein